jgi:hypothetical protein
MCELEIFIHSLFRYIFHAIKKIMKKLVELELTIKMGVTFLVVQNQINEDILDQI